jgi:YD repeat-containing protein
VTFKQTASETTRLTYDTRLGKITRVSRSARRRGSGESWSEFRYDERANLIQAWNSDSARVQLAYDANGRITRVTDKDGHLDFKYNTNSKPTEIRHSTLGAITISYKADGDIDKVDSPEGRAVALQITSSFQRLTDILRPAGVSLTF